MSSGSQYQSVPATERALPQPLTILQCARETISLTRIALYHLQAIHTPPDPKSLSASQIEIEPEPELIVEAPPSPRARCAQLLLSEAERICDDLIKVGGAPVVEMSQSRGRRSSLCGDMTMPRRLGIEALKEMVTRVAADDKAALLKEDVVKSLLERIYGVEKRKPREVHPIYQTALLLPLSSTLPSTHLHSHLQSAALHIPLSCTHTTTQLHSHSE